jgi:hypothetical protein
VQYLVDVGHLRGDAALDALGWAEDRREELNLRQAERQAAGDGGPGAKQVKLIENTQELAQAVRQIVILQKIVVVVLCVLCVLSVWVILKN